MSTYDPKKTICTGIFLDDNALYVIIISAKIPVGDFKELSEEEISSFITHEIDLDGDRCDSRVIDFEIPDDEKTGNDEITLNYNSGGNHL